MILGRGLVVGIVDSYQTVERSRASAGLTVIPICWLLRHAHGL